MTPDATTRMAPSHGVPNIKGFPWWRLVLGAAAIAVYFVGLSRLLADPAFVEGITFVNTTSYDVEVDVTTGERAGWLPLGEVEHGESIRFEDVLDQGDVWMIRFATGHGGELRLTRVELQRSGWRVQTPPTTETRLRAAWGPPEALAR